VADRPGRGPLEVVELATMLCDEALHRELRRDRRVLDDRAGARRREPLLDEAPEDVVDAFTGGARLPRDLGGGERVAAEEGDVRLGLIRGEPELGELG